MMMVLIAKNKIGFIDGFISKPCTSSPQYVIWLRCNNMVISWILNSIPKELAASVMYIDTAYKMWSDLKEHFSQGNGPRIFQLQKAIYIFSQDQMSVSNYFTKLKGLWDELLNYRPFPHCLCGAMKMLIDFQHQEYVVKFLMGLNDSFSNVRGQILLNEPLPSINKVFSLILQEEKQKELTSSMMPSTDSVALFSRSNENHGGNRFSNPYPKRERPVCSHCGITGHTVKKCYKIHDYPPGY